MLTTSLLIGLAAALVALAIAAYSLPAADPRRAKPTPTQMDSTLWVPGWPHEAPKIPFTVPQAHHVMQTHRQCRRGRCARKDAAWMTLVEAGHIRPRVDWLSR